jgi:hypothetical protein
MKAIVWILPAVLLLQLLQGNLMSVTACDGHDHSQNGPIEENLRTSSERRLQDFVIQECGYQQPSADQMAQDAVNMLLWALKRDAGIVDEQSQRIYTIPTYVHIIQPSSTTGNVDNARVAQHMAYLNGAFANSSAPFVFQYVNVTRTIRADWGDSCGNVTVELAMKALLKVGGKDSYNIYICNKVVADNGVGLAGFSLLPDAHSDKNVRDGVVLYRSDGDRRFNTLVHETV